MIRARSFELPVEAVRSVFGWGPAATHPAAARPAADLHLLAGRAVDSPAGLREIRRAQAPGAAPCGVCACGRASASRPADRVRGRASPRVSLPPRPAQSSPSAVDQIRGRALVHREKLLSSAAPERCPSGLRCQTRNLVWRKSPWVRIPPSPLPENQARLNGPPRAFRSRSDPQRALRAAGVHLERCPSGLRCMSGNHVWGNPPRVRIPPSPLVLHGPSCPG